MSMAMRTQRKTHRKASSSARPSGAKTSSARRNGGSSNGSSASRANGGSATWQRQRRDWEQRLAAAKERPGLYPFTISGVPIKSLYTPEDLAAMEPARDLG